MLGTLDNYSIEALTFEVVPFKSVYHAIFGHLAFAAFMGKSWYVYNKVKIHGKNDIITVKCDVKKARECEVHADTFAKSILGTVELKQLVT
jgi:hypothetical protein